VLIYTAPYYITQPSVNNDVQKVSSTATMANVMCSLNVTIPSSVTVTWLHNGSLVSTTSPNSIAQTGNTVTLLIGNLQSSDAGVYQCVFNDAAGFILRRDVNLLILSKLLPL